MIPAASAIQYINPPMKNIFTLVLVLTVAHFTAISSPSGGPSSLFAQFRTNLYEVGSGTTYLVDGTLTQYDTSYSNNVDGMDARKMFNPGENFGMLRNGTVLIIERRHTIINNDTIFLKMWNMHSMTYHLEMVAYNLNTPGRIGVLIDHYLKSETSLNLNDTSQINFSVTADPGSYAPDRFMVVFSTPTFAALPLTFTSVQASKYNNSIKIDWATANETSLKEYNLQKSSSGNNFTNIADINARNTTINNYEWIDAHPAEGYNYYRIEAVNSDGKINYSNVMKLYFGNENQRINIFPNPASENNLNLQLVNECVGKYEIALINSFGQTLMTKTIQYTGGSKIENISPQKNIPKGLYQLEIKMPDGNKKAISVIF